MKLLQELDELAPIQLSLKEIGNECSTFITNPVEIFRGLRRGDQPPSIQRVPIRTDRRPLDSNQLASAIFNYMMSKHLHIEDIRMKVLFCTPSAPQARMYGELSWVFPLDGSTIVHSDEYRDSIVLIDKMESAMSHCYGLMDDQINISKSGIPRHSQHIVDFILSNCSPEAVSDVNSIISTFTAEIASYKIATLDNIPTQNELMLLAPACYIVPMDTQNALPRTEETPFNRVVAAIKRAGKQLPQ